MNTVQNLNPLPQTLATSANTMHTYHYISWPYMSGLVSSLNPPRPLEVESRFGKNSWSCSCGWCHITIFRYVSWLCKLFGPAKLALPKILTPGLFFWSQSPLGYRRYCTISINSAVTCHGDPLTAKIHCDDMVILASVRATVELNLIRF